MVIVHSSEVYRSSLWASAMNGVGLQAFYRRVTANTVWGLGFKQSSFHHIARVLRSQPYNAFRLQPLYRHAVVPSGFRLGVSRLTQKFPPNFSRLGRESYAALRGAQATQKAVMSSAWLATVIRRTSIEPPWGSV